MALAFRCDGDSLIQLSKDIIMATLDLVSVVRNMSGRVVFTIQSFCTNVGQSAVLYLGWRSYLFLVNIWICQSARDTRRTIRLTAAMGRVLVNVDPISPALSSLGSTYGMTGTVSHCESPSCYSHTEVSPSHILFRRHVVVAKGPEIVVVREERRDDTMICAREKAGSRLAHTNARVKQKLCRR